MCRDVTDTPTHILSTERKGDKHIGDLFSCWLCDHQNGPMVLPVIDQENRYTEDKILIPWSSENFWKKDLTGLHFWAS